MQAELWVGHPNYSSWSLRGWLLMKIAGLDPNVHWVEFGDDEWKQALPSNGLVPVAKLEQDWVWDSIAIAEELASRTTAPIWPTDPAQRAYARSIVAEMHSGFSALRQACPMNIRAQSPGSELSDDVLKDVFRVQDLLEQALAENGQRFLFADELTAADAFYAPVIYRLNTYAKPAECALADYSERLRQHAWLQQWELWAKRDVKLERYDRFIVL